jgi:FAD/FMN-containing dehydrogenase
MEMQTDDKEIPPVLSTSISISKAVIQKRVSKMFIRRALEAALTACLAQQHVPYSTMPVEPYNLRLPYTPLAVANPTKVGHIEKAVVCAANLGIKVNARSGGHSYVSAGLGGENGHLMIDMANFASVAVDSHGIASVGTGARLGAVAVALNNKGRGLSHGSCPG